MNQPQVDMTVAPPNSWHMLRTMAGMGVLCSMLIVFTYEATLPVITQKKLEKLEEAVFTVLPGATSKITYRLNPDGQFLVAEGEGKGEQRVYAGYDAQKQLVGIAFEAQGQGFQDAIRIIYGYSPEKSAVIGIQVLETKETPGLGDKIEKDENFLKNFEALDVRLNDAGTAPANLIVPVKNGAKNNPWEVECITGATISSKAISNILRESSAAMVPQLEKHMAVFRDGAGK